ncbi:MAG: DNA-binding protein [Gammaproteobacteria bacterium]|nr:DNA-binding protein [Gammaproteobacteria bacterium]
MSRTGIGYQEVALAAEKLVQQGASPTIERIRVLLGTGSYSTVSKYLTEWKTQHLKQRIDGHQSVGLPSDSINQAVASVWEQLQRDNAAKIEEIEATANDKIQLAQAEKEHALNELHRVMQDDQDLRVLLKNTRAQNAALEKQQIALNQTLAVAESKLDLVEKAKKKFDDYANTTLASIEEKHQQALAQYETHLSETKQFYLNELSQMKEIAENQRHEHIVEIDHLKSANQKLQAQLADKDKSLIEIISRVGQLSTQLQKQQGSFVEILTGIQQNEKAAVKLKQSFSQELTGVIKQEAGKQTQQILSKLQEQLSDKESTKPAKGKIK